MPSVSYLEIGKILENGKGDLKHRLTERQENELPSGTRNSNPCRKPHGAILLSTPY